MSGKIYCSHCVFLSACSGGKTYAGLIGIFPSADPLPLDEKRSGTKLAWGSRQRRLPRLVKCRRFPTVCSRKYTQLTPLTLSIPLTIPKLTPDGIASLTWVCENFEVSLHSTPVPVTHPSGSPPMSLRHREGRQRKRWRVDSVSFRPLENACT